MYDQLNKYTKTDHFFLESTTSLEEACNAPKDKSGVFIVNELKNGRITLVYIGSSGKEIFNKTKEDGKGTSGSIYDAIVNGIQFGKTPRKQSWPVKLLSEGVDAIDVYWWVTHEGKHKDNPVSVANLILKIHQHFFDELPAWNRK